MYIYVYIRSQRERNESRSVGFTRCRCVGSGAELGTYENQLSSIRLVMINRQICYMIFFGMHLFVLIAESSSMASDEAGRKIRSRSEVPPAVLPQKTAHQTSAGQLHSLIRIRVYIFGSIFGHIRDVLCVSTAAGSLDRWIVGSHRVRWWRCGGC